LFEANDMNRRITDEAFPYYRCGSCGLVFLHPLPADLGRFYPPNYHEFPASLEDLLRGGRRTEAYKLEAIGESGRGRRLLEIGPSFGKFAALAKQYGFDVEAIEMDPGCCSFLERVVGIRAYLAQDVGAVLRGLGQYDVIALWHSLEHLPDPWSLLDALPEHLARGGLLAVATPNPWSLQFRVFGKRWIHLDAPRHVNLIPHSLLERRLTRRGMRQVHFSSEDQGAQECNLLGWIASVRTSIPRSDRHPLVSLAWRLTVPLSRLIEGGTRGAAYTMVFSGSAQ
jgi:SAM-dependent methyltransferase